MGSPRDQSGERPLRLEVKSSRREFSRRSPIGRESLREESKFETWNQVQSCSCVSIVGVNNCGPQGSRPKVHGEIWGEFRQRRVALEAHEVRVGPICDNSGWTRIVKVERRRLKCWQTLVAGRAGVGLRRCDRKVGRELNSAMRRKYRGRVVMRHSGDSLGANQAGMPGRIYYVHQSKLKRPPHASADKARLPATGLIEHAC